ncbi:putative lysophospholipase L1 biosynthesis ABC-type transport system permease subunit [Aeromicrobium sp. SORGH_AS981]|uniref:hypothetical protein n=1 Tax=Aeromicrobium sp. SORGH_AS_0981 TaxID=3041802 RepID=UPI00285D3C2C|nr:hypothetical protein [Aeromicrobium sp. SORGH_AS_0981]MDR6120106.1 putative lysophospholipase L1 biosynthesis ABC-type transport system permease subunit [Aeromicrobium sp. SORGH_AS_0981]
MTSTPRTSSQVVRLYVIQWVIVAILALIFIGVLALVTDNALNWKLFGYLMSLNTLGAVLGIIYRRPLPEDRD